METQFMSTQNRGRGGRARQSASDVLWVLHLYFRPTPCLRAHIHSIRNTEKKNSSLFGGRTWVTSRSLENCDESIETPLSIAAMSPGGTHTFSWLHTKQYISGLNPILHYNSRSLESLPVPNRYSWDELCYIQFDLKEDIKRKLTLSWSTPLKNRLMADLSLIGWAAGDPNPIRNNIDNIITKNLWDKNKVLPHAS